VDLPPFGRHAAVRVEYGSRLHPAVQLVLGDSLLGKFIRYPYMFCWELPCEKLGKVCRADNRPFLWSILGMDFGVRTLSALGGYSVVRGETGEQTDQESRSAGPQPHL
jgi:hypothetical protein